MNDVIVRRYNVGEEEALWKLYYDTTHRVNCRDYTAQQCARWAPDAHDKNEWASRLERTRPFVAEQDGQMLGFAELVENGEIEFFYCHHDWQHKGVGSLLFKALEAEANRLGFRELTAAVSVTAKDFFLRQGFSIVREQNNVICGSPAINYLMRKDLAPTTRF
jgi:putative acetyltransferase